MMQEMRDKCRRWFAGNKDRKIRIFIAIGLVGIGLIALSEWLPRRQAADTPVAGTAVSVAQVEAALEDRMTALIRQVAGVGDCRVLVTLESGSRFVYAGEQNYAGGADTYNLGEKTLVVETDSGPVGLLVTEIQPRVNGVAVVCDGGDNPAVCQQVTALVCAALNISSGRVCVAKQQ